MDDADVVDHVARILGHDGVDRRLMIARMVEDAARELGDNQPLRLTDDREFDEDRKRLRELAHAVRQRSEATGQAKANASVISIGLNLLTEHQPNLPTAARFLVAWSAAGTVRGRSKSSVRLLIEGIAASHPHLSHKEIMHLAAEQNGGSLPGADGNELAAKTMSNWISKIPGNNSRKV